MAKSTCGIEGCDDQVWARDWCHAHYERWRSSGDVRPDVPVRVRVTPPTGTLCLVPDCDRMPKSRGRCNAHYLQWRKENVPRPECSFPECGKPVDSHGLCPGHAQQLLKGWALRPLKPQRPDTCTVPDCDDPHQGLGYCNRHLIRFQKHGDPLQVRQPGEGWRKYTLNEEFFDEVTTEVQAYWLGFIAADGSVTQTLRTNTLRVGLQIGDTAHVARMNADLGSDRPLMFRYREPRAAILQVDSWRLVNALRLLGIYQNKVGTVKPWCGPADLMPAYWRGLFDGDGCICRHARRNSWSLQITGSEPCVRAFGEWAREVCGSNSRPLQKLGPTWAWTVSGGPLPRILSRALYGDATIYLQRKYDLACELDRATFSSDRRRSAA